MSTAILQNTLGRTAVIRVTGTANVNLSVANLAINASENVQTLSIRKVFWCGNCSVARGANVIFSYETGTSGSHDFYGNGMTNEENNTANLVITSTDAAGFILVEVGKNSLFNSAY